MVQEQLGNFKCDIYFYVRDNIQEENIGIYKKETCIGKGYTGRVNKNIIL